jgi:hypothetical protein
MGASSISPRYTLLILVYLPKVKLGARKRIRLLHIALELKEVCPKGHTYTVGVCHSLRLGMDVKFD